MAKKDQEISEIEISIKKELPDFKNLEYLGKGATSYCFKFDHELLGTRAIKTAKPNELIKNPKLKRIFLEEIGILSKIHHKNVITIHEIGNLNHKDQEIPYYTMEFFDFDLIKFMESEDFSNLKREDLISILRQSVDGLHHIHDVVSHNDIKESNIFIDKHYNVKIGDFGFAKYFSKKSSPDSHHGTPEYWCNELKEQLKKRSDEDPNNTVIIIEKKDRKPKWDIVALGYVFENILKEYRERGTNNCLSDSDERYLDQLIKNMKLESSAGIQKTDEIVDVLEKMRKTLWSSLLIEELSSQPRKTTVRIPEFESIYSSDRVKIIINHPWFQRLKDVRQLGLAYLVYPGAMHSRLEHSLGVYHKIIEYLNGLLADEYNQFLRMNLDEYKVKVLILAAILHDIGHFPFAHSFEDISKKFSHLGFTLKFIDGSIVELAPKLAELDNSYVTGFNKIISEKWCVDPEDVKSVLNLKDKPVLLDEVIRHIFNYILDSPIDVDKIDYIMRDSLHVGVSYGKYFDYSRFLQGVTTHEKKNDAIVILEKAKVPVEMLLLIRYAMYKDIYRHHAVRVAESMLNQAVYFFYKCKKEELSEEDFYKELVNEVFTSSDDQILEWLSETGPTETKELIERIKTRQLFKRLVVYRKGDDEVASIYENIERLKWKKSEDKSEFYNFCTILRSRLNKKFGLSMKDHEIVIDVPDPERDKIQDVFIIPEYKKEPLSLQTQSEIFNMIKDNFQKWVHKIRIFINEENRKKIYDSVQMHTPEGYEVDFDKINKLVQSAIDESD